MPWGSCTALWRPIPGEFDDYVAMPKENGYQSLHTAVIALDGKPLEVQIRTEEMHHIAQFGIAAHWRYKEGTCSATPILDGQDSVGSARPPTGERMSRTRSSSSTRCKQRRVRRPRVRFYSPRAISSICRMARRQSISPIEIHSEIGHRCRGARVDNRLVSLDYQLQNGEQVDIITTKQGGPSRDWLNPQLNYVATQRARQKISQLVQAAKQREAERLGRPRHPRARAA